MPRKKRKSKITRVKFGSVVVPIYKTRVGKYTTYTVAASINGNRERFQRASLDAARKKALDIAKRIAMEETNALKLTNAQFSAFQRAQQNIHGIPKPIELVTAEYADAYKINPDVPLIEQARCYATHHARRGANLTVPEAVTKMLAEKEKEVDAGELRPETLHDLQVRLGHFAAAFQMPLPQLHGSEVFQWLKGLKNRGSGKRKGGELSKRSRYNYRLAIQNFVNWSKAENLLDKTWELPAMKMKLRLSEIHIFTPEEEQKLLNAASSDFLPVVAILCLSSVRNKEASKLTWDKVRFDSGYIDINVAGSKVWERRLVPISANLLEILLPYRNRKGPVYIAQTKENSKSKTPHNTRLSNDLIDLAHKCGIAWKRNALRKTYISRRIAETGDVAKVAEEAGTSPRKVATNYRERMTKEEARRYNEIQVVTKVSQIVELRGASL